MPAASACAATSRPRTPSWRGERVRDQPSLHEGGRTGANEAPYGNIVAINRQCSHPALHPSPAQRVPDAERYSFLIDAGVDVHGYASDITRTWAWRRGEFADLIAALDAQQQEIVDGIKTGPPLQRAAPADAPQAGAPAASHRTGRHVGGRDDPHRGDQCLLPHGLGHFLGLQVHDVRRLHAG